MGAVSLGDGANEGNENQDLIEGKPLSYGFRDTPPQGEQKLT